MKRFGRWVIARRDAAIEEYQQAAHALAVARHGDDDHALTVAHLRIGVAQRRLDRWERIRFVVLGDGSRR